MSAFLSRDEAESLLSMTEREVDLIINRDLHDMPLEKRKLNLWFQRFKGNPDYQATEKQLTILMDIQNQALMFLRYDS